MPLFSRSHSSSQKKRDYIIGPLLGKGGYGEVKQAIQKRTGREVAIKIVEKARVPDLEAQLRRHAMLMALNHKHIVRLYEWFESGKTFYLIFEIARGGELFEHLLEEERFKEVEAREIAHALADALNYLHERLIVHRDLKLENVLYRTPPGKDGQGHADCVISDFGLSAVLKHPSDSLHAVCGSAGYTAPEVYDRYGYGIPSDMWSYGVIVFALIGGRFPYKETEPIALAHEARTTQLFFPATWNSITPLAKDFVSRCLEVDPAQRLTAAEALQHPWLTNTPPSPPASPVPEIPVSARELRRPLPERRHTTRQAIADAECLPPEVVGESRPILSVDSTEDSN